MLFMLSCQQGQSFAGGCHADSKEQIFFDALDKVNY